ncbi:MAG: nicotinamide-nucleotide amidohydrolase family protein, partial [Mariprofundaceae bacterium]
MSAAAGDSDLRYKIEALLAACRQRDLRLRTAESCTAGGIAAAIASVAGASDVLDRGWVVYSNRAKCEELCVDAALIDAHGAVSREVVEAMANGGAVRNDAGNAACIAVSGIAGPGGGSPGKPVGLVWLALAMPGRDTLSCSHHFSGDRLHI